ncbi:MULTISPECIES: VOC family protein [Leisingera]|uniref:VOC family protein n=1 Tax=Leisingera TaxID=191028 RepID=UPI001C96EC52|nr:MULTISPECIES: VOC family protein [Leisingera]MBY6058742.1 VOC family protein [Leisingera daeponensis]
MTERSPEKPRFAFDHVMIRVRNLGDALQFYRDVLGMAVIRQAEYPGGRFTNVFLAFDGESAAVELTWNWDRKADYEPGDAWGHLALAVPDLPVAMEYLASQGVPIRTPAKKMAHGSRMIGFVLDPDGHLVELVEPL